MFKDTEKTKKMIQGAYRKLKSYYYYNKNFMIMREKISYFEDDRENMYATFEKLAEVLCHPVKMREYIDELIAQIDFYAIPKKFESDTITNNTIISNTISRDKKMRTVNFFINAPIELHILDTLWTVFLAKMDYDKKVLSYSVYGNTINKSALFADEKINFENRNLFNVYFNKYSAWRNDAFEALETQYRFRRDSVLISLDIKSYFYSVSFSFGDLKQYFDNHEMLKDIKNLTNILERIFIKYFEVITPYRKDVGWMKKKHYPLPIGLFSSMVLGNVYLKEFDKNLLKMPGTIHYGRYVDVLLLVVDRTVKSDETASDILDDIFVNTGILKREGTSFLFNGYNGLSVQTDKIKLLYIDHTESKAIIDLYNDTIRVIPSQMDPLPDSNLSLANFDEIAYSVENFTKEKKIRDIGLVGIDAFKVGRFFSTLPRKYSQININSISKEVNEHIQQIEKFFTGSQSVEFYSNWLNYIYFLVITERNSTLKAFIAKAKKQINALKANSLDKGMYSKPMTINRHAKDYLLAHLEVCIKVALCLNSSLANKHFSSIVPLVSKYRNANMFEHSLVTFPLANYLDYEEDVSFCKMSMNDLGKYPDRIEKSFKFVWSPRFIHYDELLLLLFYHYHRLNKNGADYKYEQDGLVDKFASVNFIKQAPFSIESGKGTKIDDYFIRDIAIPPYSENIPTNVYIAIGSLNISFEKCIAACKNRWANITLAEKEVFFKILRESYDCLIKDKTHRNAQRETMFLVLPELCFPVYWINDLIKFAKRSQIGIITGLQYLGDSSGRRYNYIATILPFTTGKRSYKNAFLYIRDKNDYSPIEFEELAKNGFHCVNRNVAEYQIFRWKGIRIAPMVCYELTDVMARAILKGRCDFVAAPVFNPDTTYFSNIIDSTVRDLHAFVVQANTSFFGDSRVTGPYDRDSKDIFKIKGGDNDHVVIGTVDFGKFKKFQQNYYSDFDKKLKVIEKERKKKNPSYPKKARYKPDIKPLSARFKTIK